MKIVSFDQGTQKTGVAVFDNSDLIHYDVIDLHKEKDISKRLPVMSAEIQKYVEKYNPDVVIFENVSLQTSVKTLVELARLQGAIMQICWSHNIPIKIYYPSSWRKVVGIISNKTIKRAELKQQAIDMVKKAWGISVSDDVAESILIGLAYLTETNIIA